MPARIKMKIGSASYLQRVGEKDYLKKRSRIESVPMHRLVKLSHLGGRTWRLLHEGNDFFLILEALTWEEEEKAVQKGKYP